MVKQIIPANYREALSLLNEEPYQIIAGGSDLMIQKRNIAGLPPKFEKNLLYLFNLKELKVVIKEPSQIRIGSMTSLEDLLDHPNTPPLLKQVIAEMASPALRN
ncbi:MAG TPA: molybdopterin dehydrogenase, partial [Acholeplasmatales bacterium]|nr:molybdopterin dehydrogenase [Acholeplasmatales bacterium]